jgi:type I restriction enzyme S subunit
MPQVAKLLSQDSPSADLPEGWVETCMDEVAEVLGGGTPRASDPSNFSEKGCPWITPADLSGFAGVYVRKGRRDLSEKGLRSCSATMVPAGSVLLSSRAPIGYLAIAAGPLSTNQGFKTFLCREGVVPEFVYFWLWFIRRRLEEMGSGSTFAEISGRRAKEIQIVLPPTAEQRRISTKLQAVLPQVAGARSRLARASEILERFRQSVLSAACSGRLTEDWRTRNLSSGGSDSSNSLPAEWGWSNLRSQKEFSLYGPRFSSDDYSADGVPVLRTTDIDVAGKVNLQTAPRLRLTVSDLESYRLKAGDLVFTRTGSIGRVAVFNDTVDAIPGAYLIQYRLRLPMESVMYLFHFFSSRAGQQKLLEGSTGVGRPNVNAKTIDSIPIPLPPELERHEIVHRVEALFKFADVVEQRVTAAAARTARLTQTIFARAFRGELVPTEADLARCEGRRYESASALLARLDAVGMSEPGGTAMITGRE